MVVVIFESSSASEGDDEHAQDDEADESLRRILTYHAFLSCM